MSHTESETHKTHKPLGRRAYGSIGHLPNSRMGPGDHKCPDGYQTICCIKARDKQDVVIVQEKLDGSCCAVAKVKGAIVPLGRAGWPANTSPYEQHRLFHDWVIERKQLFDGLLDDGERIVGEWLAQAHGTRYRLWHAPFVAFDLMREGTRLPYAEFYGRVSHALTIPWCINYGGPMPIEEAMYYVQMKNHHGALDTIEGVVYRVERHGKVDFLAKYVRPDKMDGFYLPEVSGKDAVWNWRPPCQMPT